MMYRLWFNKNEQKQSVILIEHNVIKSPLDL